MLLQPPRPFVAPVLMSLMGIAAAVTVLLLRPSATNNLEVIILIFAFLAPTINSMIGNTMAAAAAKGKDEAREAAEHRADVLTEHRPHGPRRTDDGTAEPGTGGRRASDR